MDEHSAHQSLLSSGFVDAANVNNKPLIVSYSLKWILKIVMWMLFIAWVTILFLYPLEFVSSLFRKCTQATGDTFLGVTGTVFLIFNGPIIVLAFLSVAYLIIISRGVGLQVKNTPKKPSYNLWTFPVLVDGPLGVVSAAEFVGILLFAAFSLWVLFVYAMENVSDIFQSQYTTAEKCSSMLKILGNGFALSGILCFAFLFLPITRGSVLLRLVNIPFEHAVRYHIWLGYLTILLFTLHGLLYVIAWTNDGSFLSQILAWDDSNTANLAGVITLLLGLLMSVTSFSLIRRKYFELFFYTHQLYVVFVIFLAMHVGSFTFSIAAGGIFLFMLDRFLRFWQSRRTVNIISARCLPSGTMELVIQKPENLQYNALSVFFLKVRELSWLQWHPFSVSSSPQDGKYHISILIKVLGDWTTKLRGNILNLAKAEPQEEQPFQHHTKLTAHVEGPYGHESPYYLMYENLILVAGGVGISPFLAILSDVLHRMRQGESCLPRNILIVWAVERSIELPLLSTINMQSVYPFLFDKLNLQFLIYVTRESEPPLDEGKVQEAVSSFVYPVSNGCGISILVGTGNNIWSGVYIISSTIGMVILIGLLNNFYIQPYNVSSWWYLGLLLVACMVASVLIFGGVVIGLWHLWEKRISAQEKCEDSMKDLDVIRIDEPVTHKDVCHENLASLTSTLYGLRPDFKEIFGSISEHWGHVNVGVIVCGRLTLQSSVAKECRSQNRRRQSRHPIFHFNNHSFNF